MPATPSPSPAPRSLTARSPRGLAGACSPHGSALAPPTETPDARDHPSHARYVTIVNAGEACIIEPGVTCNHCGYCKSHGH